MRRYWPLALVLLAWLLPVSPAAAETRVALVIGNSAYVHAPALANPLNDARDMAAVLKVAGFDVVEAIDADKKKLDGAMRAFTDKLANADIALFFYAGHGLQVGAQNYLVPVDAKLERERDLEFEAVKLDFVLRQMEIDREGRTTIVILDACRDNPLSRNLARSMGTRSASIGRGLAPASTGLGTFIAYSTQPGNVALDGSGRNSPFTTALVKHMQVSGRNLPATMIEVRKDVVAATAGKQVPWDHSALTGDFYFIPASQAPAPGVVAPAPAGTNVDVAALQERLRKLEEESKRREVAAVTAPANTFSGAANAKAPATSAPTYQLEENLRFDGLKIGDDRQPSPEACRARCEENAGCVAYQHGKRSPVMGQCVLFGRIDARQADPAWRAGVRGEEAARGPAGPPLTVRAKLSRKERGFDIYEGVALMGQQIKMSATDSAEGCKNVCRHTPSCRAATYNDFFRGKNVACSVYRDASDIIPTPSSVLMVRTD